MRYGNLLAEMARKNITRQQLANHLQIALSTITAKINNRNSITLDEANSIRNFINPELSIHYLFEKTE